jgi:hypothetical protein
MYRVLSRRMKDRCDLFGGLPDTIEDNWIENEEQLEAMINEHIHLRQRARNVFEMRQQETIDPDANVVRTSTRSWRFSFAHAAYQWHSDCSSFAASSSRGVPSPGFTFA